MPKIVGGQPSTRRVYPAGKDHGERRHVPTCYGYFELLTLLVSVQEEEIDRAVQGLMGNGLQLLEVEVGVDTLLNEVAKLVRPVDENTRTGL